MSYSYRGYIFDVFRQSGWQILHMLVEPSFYDLLASVFTEALALSFVQATDSFQYSWLVRIRNRGSVFLISCSCLSYVWRLTPFRVLFLYGSCGSLICFRISIYMSFLHIMLLNRYSKEFSFLKFYCFCCFTAYV